MSQTLEQMLPRTRPVVRTFLWGTVSAGYLRIAGAGLSLVSTLVLARYLGYAAFGEFAFASATVQFMTILAKLGLDNTSLRFVAQYRQSEQIERLWGFVRTAANASGLASCALALLVAVSTLVFQDSFSGQLSTCLLASAGLLAFLPLLQLYEAMLIALGRSIQGLLSPVITPLLFMALLFVSSKLFPKPLGSPTAMLLYITAAMGAFLVARALLRQSLAPLKNRFTSTETVSSTWFAMAMPMLALHVLVYIQGQSATLFCGLFLSTEESGLYATASRIAGVALLGLQSVVTLASPRMAALHGAACEDELRKYVQLCSWASLASCLPLALVLALAGRPLLAFFGPEFVAGYVPMLLLLVGTVVCAATGPVAQLLYMTGHYNACLKLYAVIAGLAVVSQVLLIPHYGILGAAITTTGAQVVWNLALVYLAKSKLNVNALVQIASLTRYLRQWQAHRVLK